MKAENISSVFDDVYNHVILKLFKEVKDTRKTNKSYPILDALKSGFALFSLKSSSLFSFRTRSKSETSNLSSVYGIAKIPSDNGLRNILDEVNPDDLRSGFHRLFKYLRKTKILDSFRYWRTYLVVSIDGVEHFNSKKVSCPHCLKRTHQDGSTSHYHSMLSAALVHPERSEVFILDNEPIIQQDGEEKNDCERNAAKRLFEHLKTLYEHQKMVFVMDALYSCGPLVKQLNLVSRWKYIINIKQKGNKSLFKCWENRLERDLVKWIEKEDKEGKHRFGYTNNLPINECNSDARVNMLYYEWTNAKKEKKVFTWLTNIKLNAKNVEKVMKMARSRWKIENETFNTLKNQGYQFEHNFGHGQENLCTNFALLMMLAFCVDQIQQSACWVFKTLLTELKTRAKLWESIRAVFKILSVDNYHKILLTVAEMYQIRLEYPK